MFYRKLISSSRLNDRRNQIGKFIKKALEENVEKLS
jgi:hypothetical protein